MLLEDDDKKLKKIHDDYKSGKMTTGELKKYTIDKINSFLAVHQKKREEAKRLLTNLFGKNELFFFIKDVFEFFSIFYFIKSFSFH